MNKIISDTIHSLFSLREISSCCAVARFTHILSRYSGLEGEGKVSQIDFIFSILFIWIHLIKWIKKWNNTRWVIGSMLSEVIWQRDKNFSSHMNFEALKLKIDWKSRSVGNWGIPEKKKKSLFRQGITASQLTKKDNAPFIYFSITFPSPAFIHNTFDFRSDAKKKNVIAWTCVLVPLSAQIFFLSLENSRGYFWRAVLCNSKTCVYLQNSRRRILIMNFFCSKILI